MPDLAAIRARLAQAKRQIAAFSGQRIDPPFWLVEYESHVTALLAANDALYGVLLYELTMNCTEDEARDYIAKRCASFGTQAAGMAALDAQAQKEADRG